ncbi:MAG: multiheme c-type cytochrome [bacterium]
MARYPRMVVNGTLALALVLLAGGFFACQRPAEAKRAEHLRVFFSNETENELYPCYCRSHALGGLGRRGSLIAQASSSPTLVVDAGNFSARRAGNVYDEFKQDYLLRVYDLLGYAALNVGPMEVARGKTALLDLDTRAKHKLVSANVVDSTGTLLLQPYVITEVTSPDGKALKVGIVGLIAEQDNIPAKNPSDILTTTEPLKAFGAIWPELERQTDIQVVLSQLNDSEVTTLTAQYPGVDLVLGGPNWLQNVQMQPWKVSSAVVAKVGTRGKYSGEVSLDLDTTGRHHISVANFTGQVTELNYEVPDNPAVNEILDEFKQGLRQGRVTQDIYEPRMADAQRGFGGSIYCQECHGAIYSGWLKTRHNQALQTLVAKNEEHNPGCLECHTVGYGEPDGYAAKRETYILANVQCESCHGAGAEHMMLATKWTHTELQTKPTDWLVPSPKPQADTCTKCHQEDQDPHWKNGVWPYAEIVPQIGCSQWVTEENSEWLRSLRPAPVSKVP